MFSTVKMALSVSTSFSVGFSITNILRFGVTINSSVLCISALVSWFVTTFWVK